MDPRVFLQVPLNTFNQTVCTPEQPGDPSWRGILIRTPTRVFFRRGKGVGETKAFAAIPVCGLAYLDVLFPVPLEPEPILLVAKDRRTGKVYSGHIVEVKASPKEPQPPAPSLSQEDVKGLASGTYFNPNLADFVKIPEFPGEYDVHVEIRGIRSNVVRIEVVEGTPPD